MGEALRDNNAAWVKRPYGVVVGEDYKSYRESLAAQLRLITNGKAGTKELADAEKKKDIYPQMLTDPTQFQATKVSDSSIGGNDAINPYPAFCLDDDIVHGVFKMNDGEEFGMGRCYSEMYDRHQQILYMTMGVAKYRNLQTYLQNATSSEMSNLNENGTISMWDRLGSFLKSGLTLAIQLPWLPIIWTSRMISSIKDYRVTEYFYFRDTMPLYYRYVNTLLCHVAVSMGLWDESGGANGSSNGANGPVTSYGDSIPLVMKNGPDIYKLMCRRAQRLGVKVSYDSTDSMLQETTTQKSYKMPQPGEGSGQDGNPSGGIQSNVDVKKPRKVTGVEPSVLANLWTGIKTGALEGMNFIGFRIDKSDVSNESFSNSTQDSALAAKLNQKVSETRDNNLGEKGGGEGALAGLLKFGAKIRSTAEFLKGVATGTDPLMDSITYLAAGNGYFDLPKQWSGSAGISRSVSFNLKLRAATGGDNVSIFQSIMVPLTMLLAAALPRAVGDSTYTSPFLVRAFCRGMFCVPAGIISTLSVTRGAQEFGWSINRLPTVVEVSFSIEDLSPMIFLGLTGAGANIFQQAFLNNSKLHEYLSTLTGIGLKERYYKLNQLKRRFKAVMMMQRNTTFSATYWGYMMGDSSLVRAIAAMTPWSRVPNN